MSKNQEKTQALSLSRRSIFSQVLACSAQNLILLDLGITLSFTTIVIPALLGAEGSMSFTKEQASWFGSIIPIMEPIGSIISGSFMEMFGRKKVLLLCNIPFAIAWLMMYFGNNIAIIFIANAILGIGAGCMEAPVITYIGEVCHPSVRGVLSAFSQIFISSGVFLAYFFGSIMDWRTAALVSFFLPVVTMISVLLIPETPVWLISKGRLDDALKALCWVRGWTEPEKVQQEFDDIIAYQKNSIKCQYCPEEETAICSHQGVSLKDRFRYGYDMMTRKEMMRPLFIILIMFLCNATVSVMNIKPNMVNVYKTFGFPIEPYLAVVLTGALGIFSVIVILSIVRKTGKRLLILMSLVSSSVTSILIGLYAFSVLPSGTSSYSMTEFEKYDHSWMVMGLFILQNISVAMGICTMPWIMLSELFPLRGRGLGCGIAAAIAYIALFTGAKTYYNLEISIGIHGAFWFYGICNLVGFFAIYFILPETEGKTFQEIEKHFSGKHLKIVPDDRLTNKLKAFFRKDKSMKVMNIACVDNIAMTIKDNDLYKTVDRDRIALEN